MKQEFSERSDSELVKLAKINPDNFEALVVKYQQPLFYYIRRISYFSSEDIEDIVQEVFINVYKALNGFDQDLKFSSWIYRIARNTTIDAIRKKHARPLTTQLEDDELLKIFVSSTDIENEIATKDKLEKVKKIVDGLPYKYKEVMVLKFVEQKSYEEIMDILKKPKGTVAALISRGRKMVIEEAQKAYLLLDQ
jgi:RNA polymerase sigma-70 factor (ECF subfamily)